MIYSPWNHLRHGRLSIYRYLTFYWKGHSWLAKRWYTPKPFRNKAYSHKQTNCKDVWTNGGADNSQALFIACSNDVCKYLFEINEKPISEYAQCLGASLIGSISNTWYHEHWKGCRGRTEEQRISHSPKRNLQRTESEVRCMLCPCNTQCIQTHGSQHER